MITPQGVQALACSCAQGLPRVQAVGYFTAGARQVAASRACAGHSSRCVRVAGYTRRQLCFTFCPGRVRSHGEPASRQHLQVAAVAGQIGHRQAASCLRVKGGTGCKPSSWQGGHSSMPSRPASTSWQDIWPQSGMSTCGACSPQDCSGCMTCKAWLFGAGLGCR